MATIYEVAALAAVSPATVSRVMNGTRVQPDLEARVRAAASELQFVPNRTARRLRGATSEVISLIIPDIENPFFTALARGVEDRAQASGYSVVLCNSDGELAKEARYIEIVLSEHMAGVILAPASSDSNLNSLIARKRPVVAVDRGPHGSDIDAVTLDNRAAGMAAATALLDQGFRRIACITGPIDVETASLRSDGWRQVTSERYSHELPDALLRHADFRVAGGRAAMAELLTLDERPDAVVVANNLMGVGALQSLLAAGLAPPEFGFAVLGDLPYSMQEPGIVTVVPLPARELGTTAASILFDRIGGDAQPARTVVLRSQPVRR